MTRSESLSRRAAPPVPAGPGVVARLDPTLPPPGFTRAPDARHAGPDAPPEGAPEDPRDLLRALRRGWRQHCPACGGGPLYDRYLVVRPRCTACGERLDRHTADDFPAWITIMVVGHLIAPAMLLVWRVWDPPVWVHWTLWPTATLALCLLLLPRFKGMVVALQWAKRMAGFAAPRD